MRPDLHLLAAALAFGLVMGSFLNVLIHRLPRGESIVRPRSRCPHCRNPIAWFDNIPVGSYLVLRGRCRRCASRISLRYPAVETISGAIAVLVVWRYGVSLQAIWVYAFLALLVMITIIDWIHRIIPDVLSLGGTTLGWIGSVVCLDLSPIDSFLGALLGAAVILAIALAYKAIRKVDGMGGGDVKLMAMIGAFLGWRMVLPVLFLASFIGSAYGLYLLRRGGDGKTAVAFGSFLAPSATLLFFAGTRLWQLYVDFYHG